MSVLNKLHNSPEVDIRRMFRRLKGECSMCHTKYKDDSELRHLKCQVNITITDRNVLVDDVDIFVCEICDKKYKFGKKKIEE